jgi:hypothetical protein
MDRDDPMLDALDRLDGAIADADALVRTLWEGIDVEGERAHNPFSPRTMVNTLAVIIDRLKAADDAAQQIDALRLAEIEAKKKAA